MRVLIDTNIIIQREDEKIICNEISELHKILQKLNCQILVHPKSIEDIKNDKNNERREIILSKLGAYLSLENPPDYQEDSVFKEKIGNPRNSHDEIDNQLLFALYKKAVSFLITEDKGIYKKAKKFGIHSKVLFLETAVTIFNGLLGNRIDSPSPLKSVPAHNIDLSDPIFDDLKEDYPGFEDWFNKIKEQGRSCWAWYPKEKKLGAILIHKEETEEIATIPFSLEKKRRLKICLMKVSEVGNKVGELFLKLSVDFCRKNGINEMYLTHYPKNEDFLLKLIQKYGFVKRGQKISKVGRQEDVFVKKTFPESGEELNYCPKEISSFFYPSFYDGSQNKKFVIPILPEFHDRLFTEYGQRQTTLPEYAGQFVIEGNTIRKAYLCYSKSKKIGAGDLVLFYRSRDEKAITSLGVVDEVHRNLSDFEEVFSLVKNRTVYPKKIIIKMLQKPVTVILFKHLFHFKEPISLINLKALFILKSAPMSVSELTDVNFKKILEGSNIEERYIVHQAKICERNN